MKNVTITLKDESLTGNEVRSIASKLNQEGLTISSVQPYGVITGQAEEDVIARLKQNKSLFVNDTPSIYRVPPPGSKIQ